MWRNAVVLEFVCRLRSRNDRVGDDGREAGFYAEPHAAVWVLEPSAASLTTCGRCRAETSASTNNTSSSVCASRAGLIRNTRSNSWSTSGAGGSSRVATT
jgi:erythromycin esterase-like protein